MGSHRWEIPHKAGSLDMPGWPTFLALFKKGVRAYAEPKENYSYS